MKMNRYLPPVIFMSIFMSFVIPRQSLAADCSAADIELTSQEAADNFQTTYGGGGTCDTITGSLTITRGYSNPQVDIADLSGLHDIIKIGDSLNISDNPILTNLDGLNHITQIGRTLSISNNIQLANIVGLKGLTGMLDKVGISSNPALTNIDGLSSITNVGEIIFGSNEALTNIDGLSSLTNVAKLYIGNNEVLTNVDGLSSLAKVGNRLEFIHNTSLTNIDGLSSLNSVGHSLNIRDNAALTDINGLSSLTYVGFYLNIESNSALTNVNGLSSLNFVGTHLAVVNNTALTNVDGLSSLTYAHNFTISANTALTNINGLSSLVRIGGGLEITGNTVLTNVDGLSSLTSLLFDLTVKMNDSLASCEGLSRLLDQWDDAIPGPGPGESGVPDLGGAVLLGDNLDGCNSIQEIFADANFSRINTGLNDAWYYPPTSGQGFFITVFPDLGFVSLAWFTYDTEFPPIDATANLGDPGHRWLTAIGPIVDNQVLMVVEMTSGGLFDTTTEIQRTDPPGSNGTILLTFTSCNSATLEYDIPSINRQGTVPIQRVANDNIALCEALSLD
jgi:hypothetical protein